MIPQCEQRFSLVAEGKGHAVYGVAAFLASVLYIPMLEVGARSAVRACL
jgi:hypothetical protein